MTTPLSLILKPREGGEIFFVDYFRRPMLPNLGGSNGRGLQNAYIWRDLINILHFTNILRMFLPSENPRPRMALKMNLKLA